MTPIEFTSAGVSSNFPPGESRGPETSVAWQIVAALLIMLGLVWC